MLLTCMIGSASFFHMDNLNYQCPRHGFVVTHLHALIQTQGLTGKQTEDGGGVEVMSVKITCCRRGAERPTVAEEKTFLRGAARCMCRFLLTACGVGDIAALLCLRLHHFSNSAREIVTRALSR
jgi:hypothetical protein